MSDQGFRQEFSVLGDAGGSDVGVCESGLSFALNFQEAIRHDEPVSKIWLGTPDSSSVKFREKPGVET